MVDSGIDRIDFGLLGTAEFSQRIGRSLSTTGFFVLENAGIDAELLNQAYAAVADFFELSESIKLGYCLPELHGQRCLRPSVRNMQKTHPIQILKSFGMWETRQCSPTLFRSRLQNLRRP